jgi:hypothetical protein
MSTPDLMHAARGRTRQHYCLSVDGAQSPTTSIAISCTSARCTRTRATARASAVPSPVGRKARIGIAEPASPGSLYARLTIEGAGHRVPYIDTDSFPAFARTNGMAHVEQDPITCPTGPGFEGLFPLTEPMDVDPASDLYGFSDAIALFKIIAECVGIPPSFISEYPEEVVSALRRRLANAKRA